MTGEARHLTVSRTARYHVLASGEAAVAPREVWVVVHGYGQLAGRFIRHFAALDDGARLVVAPEALSRFYLEHPGRVGSANARVGATWMTREERDAEIADHVAYLDRLYEAVTVPLARRPTLHVLGFSQGVATVSRWLVLGRTRADHVVFWAGRLPPELVPPGADSPLRAPRVDFVMGDADEFATPEQRADLEALVTDWPRARLHRFAGGHVIDPATLRAIADGARALSAPASGR